MSRVATPPLRRIRVLLVAPRSPGNLGSAARAVKNMGLGRLDLIEADPSRGNLKEACEAEKLAAGSLDVLRRVRSYPTLDDAVRASAYVVATSARAGRNAPLTTPREAAPRLLEIARTREVALLFGPEHHGLPNRLMVRASECLRIPAAGRHPVLNLAQSVMLVGYELLLAALAQEGGPVPSRRDAPPADRQPASVTELDAVQREGVEAMTLIDFLKPHNRERISADLAALLARAHPSAREARMLRGMARQVRWLAGRAARA